MRTNTITHKGTKARRIALSVALPRSATRPARSTFGLQRCFPSLLRHLRPRRSRVSAQVTLDDRGTLLPPYLHTEAGKDSPGLFLWSRKDNLRDGLVSAHMMASFRTSGP